MPDFSQNIHIRIDRFQAIAQFLAKTMRNLICHIQTNSVHTVFFYPVGTDIHEVFSNLGIIRIQFRHIVKEGKCIILFLLCAAPRFVKGPLIDHKPVIVFALRAFFNDLLPLLKIISAVIEHAVKHDTDASFVCLVYEIDKGLLISKMRIDLRVICCVIFMRRRRFIDRSQIDSIDAKILQII